MKAIILVFCLATLKLFGQEPSPNYKLTKDSDTIFWSRYHLPEIEKLHLILPDGNTDFFRISSSYYYLELSPLSNKITFYVHEIRDNKQTGEDFIKSFGLSHEQVSRLEFLMDSLKINSIPSDKYISDWSKGLDGITYIIENKKGNIYSFKNYWTPSAQKNSAAGKTIYFFTNQMNKITGYLNKRKLFESQIPFYGWTYNGSMVITKVISNTREYRKYKRIKKKQAKKDEQ